MRFTPILSSPTVKIKECASFGGINATPSCQEGELAQGVNFSSRRFPALAPRGARYHLGTDCSDFFIYNDSIYTVRSGDLYKDSLRLFTLADSSQKKRCFAVVGNYLCVMPDKQFYNIENGDSGSLEATVTITCSFTSGSLFGQPAENNTVIWDGGDFTSLFRDGDGVEISGSGKNNGSYIIRELSPTAIAFDENLFTPEEKVTVTISRKVPLLDFAFECNNRLWGINGNAICASALGDPFNFNKFDGISTDSYFKEVYSSSNFTAGISYGNTPVFFKENMIYRVFGDLPSGFYLEMREAPGVSNGCSLSLANLDGALFYAGSDGIYCYQSSYPLSVSRKLGDFRPGRACGGSDGEKYYVSMSDFKGFYPNLTQTLAALEDRVTFVYNPSLKSWHIIESDSPITRFQRGNYGSANDKPNFFALDNMGRVLTVSDTISGSPSNTYFYDVSEIVECEGISGDWDLGGFSRLHFISLSLTMEKSSSFSVEVSFDGSDFIPVGTISNQPDGVRKRHTLNIPRYRFSSLRIRYKTKGDFTLHSLRLGYTQSLRHEL